MADDRNKESLDQGESATPADDRNEDLAPRSLCDLDQETVHAMIDDWFEYRNRAGITLDGLTIRELIDEGKR